MIKRKPSRCEKHISKKKGSQRGIHEKHALARSGNQCPKGKRIYQLGGGEEFSQGRNVGERGQFKNDRGGGGKKMNQYLQKSELGRKFSGRRELTTS